MAGLADFRTVAQRDVRAQAQDAERLSHHERVGQRYLSLAEHTAEGLKKLSQLLESAGSGLTTSANVRRGAHRALRPL
jgi:hypothetical protein